MKIDKKRFPEGRKLVDVLSLFQRDLGCHDIKIGACGVTHSLSQIKKNLIELSEQPSLCSEIISAAENEAADILAELSDNTLHITSW